MMKSSPLRLKELVFPSVSVQAVVPNAGAKRADNFADGDIVVTFAFHIDEGGIAANAILRLTTKEQGDADADTCIPYAVDVEVFAHFEVLKPEHADARALWFRKFSAAATLLGAAREQVAMMTARGPWGVALVPIIAIESIIGPLSQEADDQPGEKLVPAKTKRGIAATKKLK